MYPSKLGCVSLCACVIILLNSKTSAIDFDQILHSILSVTSLGLSCVELRCTISLIIRLPPHTCVRVVAAPLRRYTSAMFQLRLYMAVSECILFAESLTENVSIIRVAKLACTQGQLSNTANPIRSWSNPHNM
jgi:hypothetical protein